MIRKLPVLDALSVLVMLEHCDFDYTICTFWHTSYWQSGYNAASTYGSHPAPIKAMWCLQCVLGMVGRTRGSDGRADMVEAVKCGRIQIEALAVRDDITRCEKCNQQAPSVNPLWKENL